MWQAEIVADLAKFRGFVEKVDHVDGWAKDCVRRLQWSHNMAKESHCFYLGSLPEVWDTIADRSPLTNTISLPYKNTMICHNNGVNDSDRAILCEQTDDEILIMNLCRVYSKDIGRYCWAPTERYGVLARDYSDGKAKGMILRLDETTGKLISVGKGVDKYEEKYNSFNNSVGAAMILCKLLSCKNIATQEIKPKITRQMKRHGTDKDLYSYHVLTIRPLAGKARGVAVDGDPQDHNRVHFCRGHFKQYFPDKPLFGKFTGLYWWEPHLRGQDRSGFVDKDYEIVTEEAVTCPIDTVA